MMDFTKMLYDFMITNNNYTATLVFVGFCVFIAGVKRIVKMKIEAPSTPRRY